MIFCIYTRRLCDWQNHSGVWQIFAWISPQNAVIKLTSNILYEYRHIQNARFCYAICHSLNKCELCASNISPFRYSTNVTTHIEWYGNANRTLHATCPVITPIKLNASKPALLYSNSRSMLPSFNKMWVNSMKAQKSSNKLNGGHCICRSRSVIIYIYGTHPQIIPVWTNPQLYYCELISKCHERGRKFSLGFCSPQPRQIYQLHRVATAINKRH